MKTLHEKLISIKAEGVKLCEQYTNHPLGVTLNQAIRRRPAFPILIPATLVPDSRTAKNIARTEDIRLEDRYVIYTAKPY